MSFQFALHEVFLTTHAGNTQQLKACMHACPMSHDLLSYLDIDHGRHVYFCSLSCTDLFACRLAILGITDHYIHQRIDPLKYNTWRQNLEIQVAKHNNAINMPDQGGPDDDDVSGIQHSKIKQKKCVHVDNRMASAVVC